MGLPRKFTVTRGETWRRMEEAGAFVAARLSRNLGAATGAVTL